MKDTQLVFWDWNGTLMDDVDYSCACLNGLLAAYHYPQRYGVEESRAIWICTTPGWTGAP